MEVSRMKQRKERVKSIFVMVLVSAITFVVFGCASGPKLGKSTDLQQLLNKLPEVQVSGKNVKFEFGGDVWISKVDGKDFLAGTFTSEDTANGSVLTLKQTHAYSNEQRPGIGGDVGWVKTSAPLIVLEYKKGPPETLSVK
jgi:hypothetical protein